MALYHVVVSLIPWNGGWEDTVDPIPVKSLGIEADNIPEALAQAEKMVEIEEETKCHTTK